MGDFAPNFVLPDLEGRSFELTDVLQGGPVLLLFAPGSWSPHTRRQILDLDKVHHHLQVSGFSTLVILTEAGPRAKRTLAALLASVDRGLTEPLLSFPVLVDERREIARDYGVYRAFSLDGIGVTRPATFLIDRTGEIRFAYVGHGGADGPDIAGLVHLACSLMPSLTPAPVALVPAARSDRMRQPLIHEWDISALPRVSPSWRPLELEGGERPLSLPPGALTRTAAVVTQADASVIVEMARVCRAAAGDGAVVRVFFRDESIPVVCLPDVAEQLVGERPAPEIEAALEELVAAGDVRLYACSSSLYVWGITASDLIPAIHGSRGLIAFLVEDLAGAAQVLSY